MQLQRLRTKQWVTCDPAAKLGGGGEGAVYHLSGQPGLAAKIWKDPTPERVAKLRAMLPAPPSGLRAGAGRVPVAWPVDLLKDRQRIVGFLMPRVTGALSLATALHPKARRQHLPGFDRRYLHRTALHLVRTVHAIHASGYVIGDVNESNILVYPKAPQPGMVCLIDTDSFQVIDVKRKRVYRCPVGKPDFTPPELQGRQLAAIDRHARHDGFGLAVLLFELLMEGVHPFMGVYTGGGADPSLPESIRQGYFPYGSPKAYCKPAPVAPPFQALHPELQLLFIRCFEDGHRDPSARPAARDWAKALDIAAASLTPCRSMPPHYYSRHLSGCPECVRSWKMIQPTAQPTAAAGLRQAPAGQGYPQVRGVIQRPRRMRRWLRKTAVAALIGTLIFLMVRPESPPRTRSKPVSPRESTVASMPGVERIPPPHADTAPPLAAPRADRPAPESPKASRPKRVPRPDEMTLPRGPQLRTAPPAGSLQAHRSNTGVSRRERPKVDIRRVQRELKGRGFDPGPLDGLLGPRTERAIGQFQMAVDLPATGRLDAHTLRYLYAQDPLPIPLPVLLDLRKSCQEAQTNCHTYRWYVKQLYPSISGPVDHSAEN